MNTPTTGTRRVEGHAGQQAVAALMEFGTDTMSVSYTHLTLPTSDLV